MTRNRSEKGPVALLEKQVRPALWQRAMRAQLRLLPDGEHEVRLNITGNVWKSVTAPTYDQALDVYDAMVEWFYFREITSIQWSSYDAA